MINFVMWKLQKEKWNQKQALAYFKKTIQIGESEDFSEMAREEIKQLKNIN
jgi:hypothetical protein